MLNNCICIGIVKSIKETKNPDRLSIKFQTVGTDKDKSHYLVVNKKDFDKVAVGDTLKISFNITSGGKEKDFALSLWVNSYEKI